MVDEGVIIRLSSPKRFVYKDTLDRMKWNIDETITFNIFFFGKRESLLTRKYHNYTFGLGSTHIGARLNHTTICTVLLANIYGSIIGYSVNPCLYLNKPSPLTIARPSPSPP